MVPKTDVCRLPFGVIWMFLFWLGPRKDPGDRLQAARRIINFKEMHHEKKAHG